MTTLKLRYGAFMLGVTFLIILACFGAVYLVYQGRYVLTIFLLVALYLATYQLGKHFTNVFFLLFFVRTLRKRGGTMPLAEYEQFMAKSLGRRRTTAERNQLQQEILAALQKEGTVSLVGETIYLLD